MHLRTRIKHLARARGWLWLLIYALGASGCAASTAQASPARNAKSPQMSDATITNAVNRELRRDGAVPYDRIDVATMEGIVSLSGRVASLRGKERARTLAETVRGVRSVINRIEVRPSHPVADWQVEQDVRGALFEDPATDAYEISVGVKDGLVQLTGAVDSYAEFDLAAQVAKGVRGVRAVDNQITVDYRSDRPGREVKAEIEKRLRWDALVDGSAIDVLVDGHQVTLRGRIGSAAEKARAEFDAHVAGVAEVVTDALEVDARQDDPLKRDRRFVPKSDEEIRRAVKDALLYDPRANSFEIDPLVQQGFVSLRGTVTDLQAKRAAEQVARNTTGVVRVRNLIKVRPTHPSDETIEASIATGLLRNPFTERYEISVQSDDGRVTLTGTVDGYFEKAEADFVAATTRGVEAVDNRLSVRHKREALVYDPYLSPLLPYSYAWYDYAPYATFKSDAEIRTDIKEELFWSPFVDADEVKVSVDGGIAHLRGQVDDYSEWYSAVENAYEGGAVWVDNDLTVR